ncbi:uncharacterized protein FIBRA_08269 [Fibroporia radiculosa]|uniref:Uncharacterized protein n=1 Tax=Fibroporia radiculosa TaxID=599839 RepID=J4GWH4_9APHY|nr:uncharacterized protein FIBRA_08269 [Fibroporia radiculosa]CCM06025.1 predicted protein [Fibroporia radiculosa]
MVRPRLIPSAAELRAPERTSARAQRATSAVSCVLQNAPAHAHSEHLVFRPSFARTGPAGGDVRILAIRAWMSFPSILLLDDARRHWTKAGRLLRGVAGECLNLVPRAKCESERAGYIDERCMWAPPALKYRFWY